MENSNLQISADFDGSVAVEKLPIENSVMEIEDDRIPCTNNESLNKILQIAVGKARNVTESLKVEEDTKSRFVSRFTEVFCDIMHANVCVEGGLPWSVSFSGLTGREREQQELETEDARLSKISKEVERVARKRKTATRECQRITEIRLKHQRQNLRKLKIEYPEFVSSPGIPVLQENFPHKELDQISRDLSFANKNLQKMSEELPTLQKNFKTAEDIVRRQRALLDDTGYMSC